MVKKPMDEDRIRRKEILEQKKAARKATKEKEDTAEAERRTTLETTVHQDVHPTFSSSVDDHGASLITVTSKDVDVWKISFLDLPLDAIHLVCSMLCVNDLGRLRMVYDSNHSNRSHPSSTTSRSGSSSNGSGNGDFHHFLYTARTSYLLSRLCTTTHHPSRDLPSTRLCTSEQEARTLLDDIWEMTCHNNNSNSTGDHSKPNSSTKKSSLQKQEDEDEIQKVQHFLCYIRFIEEMVTGYATLQRSRNTTLTRSSSKDPTTQHIPTITLPKFVHGRFVSVSPEHSIVRMGGTMIKNRNGNCSGITTWGVGKRGQLGHHQRADLRHPTRLRYGIGYSTRPDLRIVQVSAGGGLVRVAHTLLLTSTGRVLSFGTGQYGALGHGYNAAKQLPDYLKPTFIDALSNVTCTCVAAGELHSAAVTVDGDVYTWGDGFCGQLGHGDKRPITLPKQVTTGGMDDECISNITCGSRHTIAITEDGECYSWGLGHFGVLGRSFTPFEYDADTAVDVFATTTRAMNGNETLPQHPFIPPARDASAELAAHLDLIANLTLDDSSDQCIPKLVDSLHGIQLVGASAGHRHSLFLDSNGYLYSCGAGSSGCLGHGTTESCMYPCRIIALNDDDETDILFRQMSAGVDISMAVSTIGTVYAWGKTEGGRIGLGMAKSQITKPRRVYLNDTINPTNASLPQSNVSSEIHNVENDSIKYKAVDVECGYVHSIIVALNGTTYICGGVGIDGEDDGQRQQQASQEAGDNNVIRDGTFPSSTPEMSTDGRPKQIPDIVIWQPLPEPKDEIVKKERWQKLGKYEVKGRTKMA